VLHGVRPSERRAVADAVISELTIRFRQQQTPLLLTHPAALDRLSARPLTVPAGLPARRLGQRVASAIHAAMEGAR
jgi:hypothetical protein